MRVWLKRGQRNSFFDYGTPNHSPHLRRGWAMQENLLLSVRRIRFAAQVSDES
jgi:hypothetical protein